MIQSQATSYRAPRISFPAVVSGSGPYTPYQPPPLPPPVPEPPQTPPPAAQALAGGPDPFMTDPGYLAALAAQQANSQQLDNALRAAREAAIVQFGDPSLAGLAGFELNPLTAAAAQQNTQAGNSTLAQLQRQRDLNQQGIVNQLAAHGIVRSGDLGYKTGQNQQNYGNALYGAQQGVLSGLSQRAQDVLSQKAGLQSTANQALTSAYNTYVSNPQFWGAADTGGQTSAANASAVAPVTAALAPSSGSPPAAISRLAAKLPSNPYIYRTTRNAAMG